MYHSFSLDGPAALGGGGSETPEDSGVLFPLDLWNEDDEDEDEESVTGVIIENFDSGFLFTFLTLFPVFPSHIYLHGVNQHSTTVEICRLDQ